MKGKIFSIITLLCISIPTTFAFEFEDKDDIPQWAQHAVEHVRDENIMKGFGDRTFRPKKALNRAEAVTLLLRAKNLEYDEIPVQDAFVDVPKDAWFAKPISKAIEQGWIEGFSDETFRPGQLVNKAEFATLIKRAYSLEREENPGFLDVPSKVWFAKPVFSLAANDLIRNLSRNFFPSEAMTRDETAWIISEILRKPRLTGTSKINEFEGRNQRSSREIAIKPKNFNPNKQGYDIERKVLLFTSVREDQSLSITRTDDWTNVGKIRIQNKLEDKAQIHAIDLKLRFENTSIGPVSNFIVRLKGNQGFLHEIPVTTTGSIFLSGIDVTVEPQGEIFWDVDLKPISEQIFFGDSGEGSVSLFQANASMVGSAKANTERVYSGFRIAPVSFEDGLRKLTPFIFSPQ